MRPLPDVSNPIVFGARPPDKESYEDICGPPQTCPDCPDPRYVLLLSNQKSQIITVDYNWQNFVLSLQLQRL